MEQGSPVEASTKVEAASMLAEIHHRLSLAVNLSP